MEREFDAITGEKTRLEELYVLKGFPVNMLTEYGNGLCDSDVRYDMSLCISPSTGIIQLRETLPEELVYIDAHSNAVGGLWHRHHELLAKTIRVYEPRKVLEIGGGTGVLEHIYNDLSDVKTMEWTIIDPQPNPIDTKAYFVKGFFPEVYDERIQFDTLVHSHVWEHAFSPCQFIDSISRIAKNGMRMFFSVPDLKYLLTHRMTSVLNFEHTVYLTEDYIDYLLAHNGFTIENKVYFENHSIIYSTLKTNRKYDYNVDFAKLYNENKKAFFKYIDEHKQKMKAVNSIIQHQKNVYLFGGHITAQYYVAFGLMSECISGVLDNDNNKWGKRVAGTQWKINPPQLISELETPTIILPSSPYSDEIKKQIRNEICESAVFIDIGNV